MSHGRLLAAGLLALVTVTGGVGQDTPYKAANTPDNLKGLFGAVHQAVHGKKDAKRAAELFRSLVPDEARTRKALRDGVPADTLRSILDLHKKLDIRESDVAMLARPEQTEVRVTGATTEELATYAPGSAAVKAFPGGAKKLAEQALRTGVTFYEVEFLEPGKDAGMKYHLCYWDGTRWSMLGPVWRVVK